MAHTVAMLRSPFETLAGACYLPRFIDKARLSLVGSLPREYRAVFGNRRGVDGQFLAHFGVTKDEFLAAVQQGVDDAAMASWFASEAQRVASIGEWNELAPTLGRAGTAMEASFAKARLLYSDIDFGDDVDTVFEAICRDEKLPYPLKK